jgi:hypothetical protein
MEDGVDILIENAIFYIVLKTLQKEADLVEAAQGRKKRWESVLLGSDYVNELLNSNHPSRI